MGIFFRWIIGLILIGLIYYLKANNKSTLLFVIGGGMLGIGFLLYFEEYFYLNKQPTTYTIATTYKWHFGRRGMRIVDYVYYYKGKKYIGSYTDSQECLKDSGERHFIKISKVKPEIGYFINDKLVPDRIKEPPIEGWSKLPKFYIKGTCLHTHPVGIDDTD